MLREGLCDDRKGVHLLRLLLGQQLMPFHVVDKLAERDKDAHIDLKVEALDDGLRKVRGTRGHEGSWREGTWRRGAGPGWGGAHVEQALGEVVRFATTDTASETCGHKGGERDYGPFVPLV